MIPKQFVRRVLLAGTVVGTSAVPQSTKCDQICRASELPVYMSENDCVQTAASNEELCPEKIGLVEGTVGAIRRQIWGAMDQCAAYQKEAEDVCEKGSEYASSLYTYLSEEADETTKMGAVGAGALTGLILGLRGGIFRKLLYTSVGAYGMATVCYPQKTADYSQEAIKESKKYATIVYNFIYGVKKDDIQLPQLPKLPSSMGEVWDMAGSLGKSASSLITGSSDAAQQNGVDAQLNEVQSSDEVVEKSHASASESCHCPVGACLGRHDQKDAN